MKIQWNKVTWYSKLIAFIIFIALPFVFFYYGEQYGKNEVFIGQTPSLTSSSTAQENSVSEYYNDTAEWQTDANNTQGGFSISYPIDFSTTDNYSATPSTDLRVNSNNEPGIEYFTLTVPKVFEPQTNFSDAMLTVGASANATAVSQCMTADQSGGPTTATSSVTINGVQFVVFQSSDAGAGNEYQTTSYRTVHADKCYAVEYTIHSNQIANYPSSYNLQPFDETKIDSLMQNIVGTFMFL